VLATAGHVDHGKSTLVQALTGRDPDRLREERERGLTIQLGYAWTTLPSGAEVAFVDVPGHQRFVGTMLSGLGPAPAVVFVVAADQTFGIVSDIDDTIITTTMPRPMIAAYNTFFRHEGTRRAVPGMATMYRELLAQHPGAPIVYVSTGAWNAVPPLTRFMRRAGYPLGPLLMTEWGPTNTGWFRSGQDHKRACLHRLARELPEIRWVLIGDDGQHDPSLYGEFAEQRPDRVRAIGIRVLTATEQLLSHFTPIATDDYEQHVGVELPVCRAEDGWTMIEQMRKALGSTTSGAPRA
jgi:phosphatidate phosphatase APP1